MSTHGFFSPDLFCWLDEDRIQKSLVLLDVELADVEELLRFNLDAIFNAIPIRRGILKSADYYVATSGGRIEVFLDAGELTRSFTQEISVETSYSNQRDSTDSSTIKLSPSIEVSDNDKKVKASGLEAGISTQTRRSNQCNFNARERVLSPTFAPPTTIRWDLRSLRGEKAVSDFVQGNLYLFFVADWQNNQIEGRVRIVPDRVEFYDSDRRPLGHWQSIAMLLTLRLASIQVLNADGLTIDFEVQRDGN